MVYSDNICNIFIQTDIEHRVNATVKEVVVTPDVHDETCMYNGLVPVENLGVDDYKEIESLCDNHDKTQDSSKSFYSHNSTMQIILNWYSIYSTISVKLNISHTRCKPVYIDICYFVFGIAIKQKYQTRHHLYLNYISQYSNITIMKDAQYFAPYKYLSQLHGKCIILISTMNQTLWNDTFEEQIMRELCNLEIDFINSQVTSIKGSLQDSTIFNT